MGKTEKMERKSRKLSDQKTKKQKTKIWDGRNKSINIVITHVYNVELVDKSTLDTLNFMTGNAV